MSPRWSIVAVWIVALGLVSGTPASSQPRDLERWLAVETSHFYLVTNTDPVVGREVIERLEQFRGAFARLAPALELRSPAPTTLFAFRDAESFAPYKGRADRGASRVLGQFVRTRDGNYLSLDASSELADAFSVLYHEYVHFLVLHNFPRVPLWFNEGLAEYYSTFRVDDSGRGVVGRPVERHVRALQADGDFSLTELLDADTTSASYHDPGEVGRFYALSWLMVHYLLSGGADEVDRVADFFLRLDDGEVPDRAFEAAFERGLTSFEAELRTYLAQHRFAVSSFPVETVASKLRMRRLPAADTLYQLGDLAVHLGRPGDAERHFQLALDHRPQHADSHAGLAHVRDLQQRLDEAEILYREAVRLGTRRALSHVLYGRHSLTLAGGGPAVERRAAAERARSTLERAVELDPRFGEARALLALAHLQPGGDLDQAVSQVAKARELMPQRLDLVALDVRARLRQGEIDRAIRVLTHDLVPFDDNINRVSSLWEDVDRTRLMAQARAAFERGDDDEGLRLFDEAVDLTTDDGLRARLEDELLRLQRAAEAKGSQ